MAGRCRVELRPQALEVRVPAATLEGQRATLDAPDGVCAGDDGDVRVADGLVLNLVLGAYLRGLPDRITGAGQGSVRVGVG